MLNPTSASPKCLLRAPTSPDDRELTRAAVPQSTNDDGLNERSSPISTLYAVRNNNRGERSQPLEHAADRSTLQSSPLQDKIKASQRTSG
ncbi:hypothetical protein NMY22_g12791 [Coprinellus aureogranulatus]|nr:hypothetical protein NMY22_g12791 [Coprinellus aureogranulatus]